MMPRISTRDLREGYVDVGVTTFPGMHASLPVMRLDEATTLRDALTKFLNNPAWETETEGPADENGAYC